MAESGCKCRKDDCLAIPRSIALIPANSLILRATNLRDQEAGGSNPLAPTILFKYIQRPATPKTSAPGFGPGALAKIPRQLALLFAKVRTEYLQNYLQTHPCQTRCSSCRATTRRIVTITGKKPSSRGPAKPAENNPNQGGFHGRKALVFRSRLAPKCRLPRS